MPGKGRGQAVAAAAKKASKPVAAGGVAAGAAVGVQKATLESSGTPAAPADPGGILPALPADLLVGLLIMLVLIGLVYAVVK